MRLWHNSSLLSKLSSKSLTLFLLAGLVLVLMPATISRSPLLVASGRWLLGMLAINLLLCTVRHWQRLPLSVITIHAGVLIILSGSALSHAGFIATINIHEGGTSGTAFRWDRESEMPLGFTLKVNKVHQQYYPVGVKVGVLMDGKAERLHQLRTGEAFSASGYRVDVLELDPATPALLVAVTDGKGIRALRTVTKETDLTEPGLSLQLVAFQTPSSKRSWVDMELLPEHGPPVTGTVEVNRPLCWQGHRLFHTATGVDADGRRFAGIQIVKDPGTPLVYGGFVLLFLGNGLLLLKRGGRLSPHVIKPHKQASL